MSDKKRLKYIDALRGFTMCLVVFNHIENMSLGIVEDSLISNLFMTFRMPMFFFISGYLAYKSMEWWNGKNYVSRLLTKAKVQIIPTIIFLIIACISIYKSRFPQCLYDGCLAGYWFTVSLFQMFIVYFSISYISNKLKLNVLTDIVLISLALVSIFIFSYTDGNNEIWLLLCGQNSCRFFQFFVAGVLMHKYKFKVERYFDNQRLFTLAFICFIVCFILIWHSYFYDVIGNTVVLAIKGIIIKWIAVYLVFSLFYRNKGCFEVDNKYNTVIQFVGKRTLDIYLIHYFLLPDLKCIAPFLSNNSNIVIEFTVCVVMTILIVALCLGISACLRQSKFLGHYLFGAKY